MRIYVINKSTVLEDSEVKSWMPSFNTFLGNVRQWYPRPSELVYVDKASEPEIAWKVIFADTSNEAGALGYHDFTPDGRPISYVFAKDDLEYGYSPTVTATHEIAEMIGDPWCRALNIITDKVLYINENADPVEADEYGYKINGVLCSDFVLPKWFIPGSTGKFDYCGHVEKPLQLLPGGYMSIFVSGKGWTQIFADKNTGEIKEVGDDPKSKGQYGRLMKYQRRLDDMPLYLEGITNA